MTRHATGDPGGGGRTAPLRADVLRPAAAALGLALALGLEPGLGAAEPAAFRAGAARVAITPGSAVPMAGYYHARESAGTLDDLHACALVLDDGARRVALVTLDLITTTRPLTDAVRAGVEARTGIPADHVMVSATHAHTGPELAGPGAREAALPGADGDAAARAARYSAELPGRIVAAVEQAAANLAPAVVETAAGRCDNLAFNRRFHLRDGSVGWNPGKGNPDILQTAGPTDPTVGLVVLSAPGGPARAAYVNFALHPDTTGGARFSADYPGVLAARLADCWGPGLTTLFGNGTCGNVNHLDVSWPRPQSGPGETHRIGTRLAAAVLETARHLQPVPAPRLAVRSEILRLPLAPVTAEEVARARVDVRTARDSTREGFMRLVEAHKVLAVAAREGRPLEVEVQVVALGPDLAWVALPGEVFVELGLTLRRASPFRLTLPVELANGSIGYIPDLRAYAEGNYEPVSARCAAGSGEMLVASALRLLQAVRSDVLAGDR